MKLHATRYKRHRFPPEIIRHAVWLYSRFNRRISLPGEASWAPTSRYASGATSSGPDTRIDCGARTTAMYCSRSVGTRTTGPSCRTSRLGSGSGEWGGSSPSFRRNGRPRPRRRLEPVEPQPRPDGCGSLPDIASERLCVLGPGGGGLTAVRLGELPRRVDLGVPSRCIVISRSIDEYGRNGPKVHFQA